jgi:hypothetical protein
LCLDHLVHIHVLISGGTVKTARYIVEEMGKDEEEEEVLLLVLRERHSKARSDASSLAVLVGTQQES